MLEDSKNTAENLVNALLSMNSEEALRIVTLKNQKKIIIKDIEWLLTESLSQIGEGWENGNVSLAQVYMSGRICENIIREILPEGNKEARDRPQVYTVVLEDYHVIGQRILNSILRINGYEVIDLGYGITVDDLVSKVIEKRVKYLMISTLMLRAALKIKEFLQKLKEQNIRLKVIVGGAPFNFDRNLWNEVGANAMGVSTSQGVQILNQMIKEDFHDQ